MAYVIALMDEKEERELEELGFEVEPCACPDQNCEPAEEINGLSYRMVWVDCAALDLLRPRDD